MGKILHPQEKKTLKKQSQTIKAGQNARQGQRPTYGHTCLGRVASGGRRGLGAARTKSRGTESLTGYEPETVCAASRSSRGTGVTSPMGPTTSRQWKRSGHCSGQVHTHLVFPNAPALTLDCHLHGTGSGATRQSPGSVILCPCSCTSAKHHWQ